MKRWILIVQCLLYHMYSMATIDPYIFTGEEASTAIGEWCSVFEDASGALTVEDVWGKAPFEPSNASVPNHGVSRAAHWHQFKITNASSSSGISLSIPYAEIDHISLYKVSSGIPQLIGNTGRAVPWNMRTDQDPEFIFHLSIPPGSSNEFLLRTHGFKAIHLPLMISNQAVYAKVRADRNLLLGCFGGVMLVLAVYNLFIFLSIKDKSYLLYVIYILAISSAQTTLLGYGPFEIFRWDPWLGSRASILFALASVGFGIEFARRFMRTGSILPKMDSIAKVFHFMILVNLIILFGYDPWVGYESAQAITGLSAVYLIVLGIGALKKRSREARFFLLAWSMFLLGVLVFLLKDANILPFTHLTQYAMPTGSAIEGVLLSFGLADRINILRREKEESQAESLRISKENERIIREQNVILENSVKQRTHALQESHEHLKRTQTQLVNAEKMASLGQLTAGIAHEINNPINFITSNIQPLRRNIREIVEVMDDYRNMDPQEASVKLPLLREKDERMGIQESIAELDDIINSIAEGSSRTAEIVRGLRNFSRLDESDLKESDLHEGLRNTITVLAPQFRDRVILDTDLGDIPKVECFPGKVNQVFMNILTNAVQATLAKPGTHTPRITVSSAVKEHQVMISIRDNGIGMTDEVKARIFDPFFTTKPVGEGTGLGMAIVYGIVEDHHGQIIINSTPGEGTEFQILLPIRHMQLNERRA